MSHFICTFGQVLSEWMEKNCYNATSLTKKMNEKSRTVIARLMKDESGYKSCSAFWKRFRKAFPELSQTDSKRFEEGLEVEKLGLEQYQIRSLFQSQLMGPEQPERPSELSKKLNAWIGEQSCEILALGCFRHSSCCWNAPQGVCPSINMCWRIARHICIFPFGMVSDFNSTRTTIFPSTKRVA